ncbi:MAG: carboxypeptidase regulatory-like domain-containing protein, partial [Isosphaeraceae bacterium]|nr:carboxypeptidase regulatory-like domain-containing protein [Isosphaeraceae bacterium]
MRTPSRPACLLCLWLIPLVWAGCSSVPRGMAGREPRIQTLASVGGKPLPPVAGTPGASIVVDEYDPSLPPTDDGRISGRVVDEQGQPVPDVEVRVAADGTRAGRTRRAWTDAAGRFTLHGLLPGRPYTIIAERAEGRQFLVGRVVAEAPDTRVRIALHDPQESRVGVNRASDRRETREDEGDEEDRGAALEPINEEDLPLAAEARGPSRPVRSPAREARAGGSGWTRMGALVPESSMADRAEEQPPGREEEPSFPAATSRGESNADAEVNPLPPAIEPPRRSRSEPPEAPREAPPSPQAQAPARSEP